MNLRRWMWPMAAMAAVVGPAPAQERGPDAPVPPAGTAPRPPPTPLPSLDELLGVAPARPGTPAPDPQQQDLERRLRGEEIAEQFRQAVDLMARVAERIEAARDPGLTTQRMQEEILRKLDMIIHAAQEQARSRTPTGGMRGERERERGEIAPGRAGRQAQGSEPAPDTAEPPAREDGPPGPPAVSRGAAWGALPERLREALLQGSSDRYSTLYRRWTEAYYRRLAEERPR